MNTPFSRRGFCATALSFLAGVPLLGRVAKAAPAPLVFDDYDSIPGDAVYWTPSGKITNRPVA